MFRMSISIVPKHIFYLFVFQTILVGHSTHKKLIEVHNYRACVVLHAFGEPPPNFGTKICSVNYVSHAYFNCAAQHISRTVVAPHNTSVAQKFAPHNTLVAR